MSKKAYELGILVGRFQNLHLGHEDMIRKALAVCDTVAVFIGSSQESGTSKNPYSYELRAELLRAVFGDQLQIFPLPDIGIGNTALWGEYVLDNVKKQLGRLPDLLVTGKEARRVNWLDGEQGQYVSELQVPKKIDISATEVRSFLLNNDRESWEKYTSPELWSYYEALQQLTLAAKDVSETASL